ncbi:MAG: hypothetical protein OEL77_06280 [Nitrosopumilus sp.]|nr:hypothetical protein [Nitrosopumilus sp.]
MPKNDITSVFGLLYELGRPKPELDSDFFRRLVNRQVSDSDKRILVAKIDDVVIVGMAGMVFLSRLNQKGSELYSHELIVTQNY